jgi:hypothetical protein
MSDPAADVVRDFLALTPDEKIRAYLEIEEAWKALQGEVDISAPPNPGFLSGSQSN